MNIAQFLEQRGHQQGLKQGLQQGLQQGLEQGEQQTAERIARAMLASGLDLSLVAKLDRPRPRNVWPGCSINYSLIHPRHADRAASVLCFRQCVSVNHNKHEYSWR
ncbi:hypothetical protein LNP26_18880 [Klebsiella variicola subsp. variicola]|nr:hypothetical protein [Klebsiella variicola subsp. variicola]